MTLKKAILRGLIGIPIGVFITTTIGLAISLIKGELALTAPFAENVTALTAYTVQYAVSMILGFTFALGSAIFQVDRWSIAKQTVLHLLLTSVVFLPCAVLVRWVESDLTAIAGYFGTFIMIYAGIWIVQYMIWKNRITTLNKKLQHK